MTSLPLLEFKPTQKETPKRIARWQRQEELIQTLFKGHKSFKQAADELGISRKTAYVWFEAWKQREGVEVDREFWQLLMKVREKNPEKALECLTRLKYRMTPQKLEVKEEVKVEEKHVTVIADYTRAIEAAVNRDLEALRARKQMDTPTAQNSAT